MDRRYFIALSLALGLALSGASDVRAAKGERVFFEGKALPDDT